MVRRWLFQWKFKRKMRKRQTNFYPRAHDLGASVQHVLLLNALEMIIQIKSDKDNALMRATKVFYRRVAKVEKRERGRITIKHFTLYDKGL